MSRVHLFFRNQHECGEDEASSSSSVDGAYHKINYNDEAWELLPPSVFSAAKILGYNGENWNDRNKNKKDWDDLSEKEQMAAGILGFDSNSWSKRRCSRKSKRNGLLNPNALYSFTKNRSLNPH